jgi:hypothetical protein
VGDAGEMGAWDGDVGGGREDAGELPGGFETEAEDDDEGVEDEGGRVEGEEGGEEEGRRAGVAGVEGVERGRGEGEVGLNLRT